MAPPIPTFISCAPIDAELAVELEKHLAVLRREGLIDVWHLGRLRPGEDAKELTRDRLAAAKLFLLLVSADYLASDKLYEAEVMHALKRHEAGAARVLPILLRSVEWESTPLARLSPLPEGGRPVASFPDPSEAWANVVRGVRAVAEELAEAHDRGVASDSSAQNGVAAPRPPPPRRRSALRRRAPVLLALGVLLLFAVASLYLLFPSHSYRGVIQHDKTGTPIHGAKVLLLGTRCAVVTDANGVFDFEDCDSTSVSRLERPRIFVEFPDKSMCSEIRIEEPPTVTLLWVNPATCNFRRDGAGPGKSKAPACTCDAGDPLCSCL